MRTDCPRCHAFASVDESFFCNSCSSMILEKRGEGGAASDCQPPNPVRAVPFKQERARSVKVLTVRA